MNHTTTFKARPTTYKGIEMRSRLEAGFAMWLDANHFDWKYEPKCFAGEAGQYLPDFGLYGVQVAGYPPVSLTVYVETKHALWSEDWDDLLRVAERMRVVWETEPHAFLAIAQPEPSYPILTIVGDREAGIHLGGWVASRSGCAPNIALPLTSEELPWYGEWWKG